MGGVICALNVVKRTGTIQNWYVGTTGICLHKDNSHLIVARVGANSVEPLRTVKSNRGSSTNLAFSISSTIILWSISLSKSAVELYKGCSLAARQHRQRWARKVGGEYIKLEKNGVMSPLLSVQVLFWRQSYITGLRGSKGE